MASIRSALVAVTLLATAGCASHHPDPPITLTAPPEGGAPGRSPQPQIASQVRASGPWTVHFGLDSTDIDPDAAAILDEAASARTPGRSDYRVEGHADSTGAAAHNLELSMRRAQAVRSYLTMKGVPPRDVSVRASGSTRLRTTDGDQSQNRRVEVTLVDGGQ